MLIEVERSDSDTTVVDFHAVLAIFRSGIDLKRQLDSPSLGVNMNAAIDEMADIGISQRQLQRSVIPRWLR